VPERKIARKVPHGPAVRDAVARLAGTAENAAVMSPDYLGCWSETANRTIRDTLSAAQGVARQPGVVMWIGWVTRFGEGG